MTLHIEDTLVGVFKLKEKEGLLTRNNLEFDSDQKTICEYEGQCEGDCENEIRYQRIDSEPMYVRVTCRKLVENFKRNSD